MHVLSCCYCIVLPLSAVVIRFVAVTKCASALQLLSFVCALVFLRRVASLCRPHRCTYIPFFVFPVVHLSSHPLDAGLLHRICFETEEELTKAVPQMLGMTTCTRTCAVTKINSLSSEFEKRLHHCFNSFCSDHRCIRFGTHYVPYTCELSSVFQRAPK